MIHGSILDRRAFREMQGEYWQCRCHHRGGVNAVRKFTSFQGVSEKREFSKEGHLEGSIVGRGKSLLYSKMDFYINSYKQPYVTPACHVTGNGHKAINLYVGERPSSRVEPKLSS